MRNAVRIFSFLCGLLILTSVAQAQESRYLQPTASLYGNTGLWKVLSPDTLPPGQAAFSVWYDRISRNPGWLTISTIGVGGSAGLTDWLEFGASFDINRRVLVRRQNQLSFGQQQLGFFGNKTAGSAPLASELMTGTQIPQLRFPPSPAGALTGAAGYYNLLPFASQNQGNGVGPVTLGFKANVFSESKGDPLGFGARIYAMTPTRRSMTTLLAEPTQTGAWQQGVDLIVSKGISDVTELYWNAGFRNVQSPDHGKIVRLSDSVPLSFGLTIPRNGRFQFVEEVNADLFVGSRTPNTSFGAEDPVDVTLGFRAFLSRYLNLSAGYRTTMNQGGGDKNGFVVNLGYNYGPPYAEPIPAPPTLTCRAEPSEVLAGETVTLSAQGTSSTGTALTYLWVANAGTIEGSGPTVQLRTTNLGPGTYMATVRASEPPNVFSDCTVQVRIRAPQPPPPPPPPTVTCSAERPTVRVGEVVTLTARAQSPANRPLTYRWVSNAGRVEGTGATVRFDTTNLYAGTYTVQVIVTDDANQSAWCSLEITVEVPPPPPPPQPVKLGQCSFGRNSARVDNVCKAILDNVALRLQSEAEATLAIFGYAETAEQGAQRLARSRAENASAYLVRDKGMARSRVAIGTGTLAPGAASRRVEMHLVPRGAR
ncbi:MAG: OmpA family protein [Acidobacteria bacterium]|nr:OmpA family protein [Acidobacteriota bacterium]